MILPPRETQILRLIRRHGPLSRLELHRQMGLRPNTVGDLVASLVGQGLLREGSTQRSGPGRPRQPLDIDADRRRVIGLAFEAGRVSACKLNLLGQSVGPQLEQTTRTPRDLVSAASSFLQSSGGADVLAIGISTTGFVEAETRSILTSSATFRQSRTSLEGVYAAAGDCPVLLENDMHALAAYWLLSQNNAPDEDVLLILLEDGAIGAALLVAGKPNRGCVCGGNELGHMRMPVETDRCYCGQSGCLERICSTDYLRRIAANGQASLLDHLACLDPADAPAMQIVNLLATGIANAINFIRPNRVVLSGRVVQCLPFSTRLVDLIRAQALAPLSDRVHIDLWDRPRISPAESAAWLALAAMYQDGWGLPA
jgi:predicted NBD/HSP70 family sugar kinase